MDTVQKTREYGIDWLKALAIVFIIFTHCNWSQSERISMGLAYWIELAVPVLMIVTGYNYYNSLNRIGGYNKNWLKKNCIRILIPYAVTMVVETVLMYMMKYSLWEMVKTILTGGLGPGSYYTVVMIQVIVMYPIIYWLVQKRGGTLFVIFLNLVFEIVVAYTDMNPMLYRLLSLRYLTFLAIGACYAKNKANVSEKTENILRWLCLGIGIIIVYLMNYSGLELIIFKQWTVTAMPVAVLSFCYYLCAKKYLNKQSRVIEIISKSSFHIYLVQMVYFKALENVMHKLLLLPSEFYYFIINVIICILVGIIFYVVEERGRKKWKACIL